jgi:hypothetical protein
MLPDEPVAAPSFATFALRYGGHPETVSGLRRADEPPGIGLTPTASSLTLRPIGYGRRQEQREHAFGAGRVRESTADWDRTVGDAAPAGTWLRCSCPALPLRMIYERSARRPSIEERAPPAARADHRHPQPLS